MTAQRGVQIYRTFYSFNRGARWSGWSTPRAGHFTPGKKTGTHSARGWVGPRAGLDDCGTSRPHWDSIPRLSNPYQVAIPTVRPSTWSRTSQCEHFCTETIYIEKCHSVIIPISNKMSQHQYLYIQPNVTVRTFISNQISQCQHFYIKLNATLSNVITSVSSKRSRCQHFSFLGEDCSPCSVMCFNSVESGGKILAFQTSMLPRVEDRRLSLYRVTKEPILES
jgi:hypothetical protein